MKINLSELTVTPQGITLEKVVKYYINNILLNNIEFKSDSNNWEEYEKLCEPYCKKYGISNWIGRDNFKKLSQPDLNKFYKEMRALVRKHVGKEILNELQVKPQNISREKVEDYYENNIIKNHIEFESDSEGWIEYIKLRNKYNKLGVKEHFFTPDMIKSLSQSDLNKFYKEMRALVRKHVGKEILSELQVTNLNNISSEQAAEYYRDNILGIYKMSKYKEICKPYCIKYKIFDFIGYDDFKELSQSDLNKLYREMKKL